MMIRMVKGLSAETVRIKIATGKTVGANDLAEISDRKVATTSSRSHRESSRSRLTTTRTTVSSTAKTTRFSSG
jgi:hypothetical protein